MSRIIENIKTWWNSEITRHFLWLPVAFGLGVGIYYALPVEPPSFLLPLLAVLSFIATIIFWKKAKWPLLALLLVMLGAAWVNLLTLQRSDIILNAPLTPRPVIGIVDNIERTEHGVRFTLSHVTVSDVPEARTPNRVRLSIRLKKDDQTPLPNIGDGIHLMAGLMPPMGPALPHGFDFAQFFYNRNIGAIGYGMPPWQIITPDPSPGLWNQFRTWRVKVTEDIIAALGKGTGGVAAGLITGDARAITEDDFEALRASNLYHIIAISGEHMVVIAGVIFISLRLLSLLVLPKRISLRPQVKSIAAGITLLLITAYLFVTGTPISAVRAYVMIVLVLLAILFRRQVDPMRSLSIAALIMLVIAPSDLLEPGFQLSFAATLAIVALVESRVLRVNPHEKQNRFIRAIHLLVTMLLISVVAEIATAPIAISHFNNVSLYGVFANMLATPLMSFFLMPTVALFFILLPFGLHHIALSIMKFGIDGLLALSRWVAGFPHAQQFVSAIPSYGIALFAFGLLWVCLWQSKTRRYGFIAMMLGVMAVFLNQTPDVLVGSGGKQIAIRTQDGFRLAHGRATSMVPELWANGLGYAKLEKAEEPDWRCDNMGCIARVKEKLIAFPRDGLALTEDCRRAAIVVTPMSDVKCDGAAKVIDATTFARAHVVALWLTDNVRIETSADWQGERPWSHGYNDDESDD